MGEVTGNAIGVAMLACLWAYNGWFQAGFVGGEIKNPGRYLPLSLGIGVGVVMLLYLLANVAYMKVLTVEEIAATDRVAAVVLERVFGPAGGTIISLIILISIMGAVNAGILTGPRVYFAQARDGLFFKIFGEVHAPDLNADPLRDGFRRAVTASVGPSAPRTHAVGDALARRDGREGWARRAVRPSVRAGPRDGGFSGRGPVAAEAASTKRLLRCAQPPAAGKHGTRSDEDGRAVLAPLSLGG
jgi:hypothetical protein